MVSWWLESLEMKRVRGWGSRNGETSVRGEARFIHPVVNFVVGPIIGPFNLGFQVLREEINLLMLVGDDVIELRIEHSDDLAGLDVDLTNSDFIFRRTKGKPHC